MQTVIECANNNWLTAAAVTAINEPPYASNTVTSLALDDERVEFFDVATLNTDYSFARHGRDDMGFATWLVIDGREQLIGETVLLFGINERKFQPHVISTGGRLGICRMKKNALPWYTSTILNLSQLSRR